VSTLSLFGHRGALSRSPEARKPSPDDRRPAPERRRHVRVPLFLRGRYMLEGGCEYPCVTRNISRMGVAIQGVPVGGMGERVIAYLEELGRIEGRIVRRSEDWFAIELVATPHKLEQLDEKISVILRRMACGDEAAE
jgi:hypothetical protein